MKKHYFILLMLVISYFIFSNFYPSLIEYEKNWQGDTLSPCNQALAFIKGRPIDHDDSYFCGKYFPIGYSGRHGALEVYLLVPFFLLFGVSLEAVAICTTIFGILIIILTYYLGYLLFNRKVGFISALLLSADIYFKTILKSATTYGFPLPLFSLLSLIFFCSL